MTRILFVALGLVAWGAQADQLAWIKKDAALEAVALLRATGAYVEYCEPCGEADKPVQAAVTSVRLVEAGVVDLWEVHVNGKPIDLAYTFVAAGKLHVNLALLVGLKSAGTSRYLTAEKVASLFPQTKKVCGVIDENVRPGVPEKGGDADLRVKFSGGEYVLSFTKNPALRRWLEARKPIRGCITYDGKLHQGFEGTVIEALEFSYR